MKKELYLDDVIQLRKEIPLGSLYIADYRNSFGVDPHLVCDFFDGYLDYIQEIMEEDGEPDEAFFELLDKYDTEYNLEDWWYCHEECPLWVEEDEEPEEEN